MSVQFELFESALYHFPGPCGVQLGSHLAAPASWTEDRRRQKFHHSLMLPSVILTTMWHQRFQKHVGVSMHWGSIFLGLLVRTVILFWGLYKGP